jgi:pimeloyl-ACP methyl ester carboxylesterase
MDTINYREQGSGSTVILIHGFPMNQQVWNDFSEKLSDSIKIVTLDLPGFGKSAGLADGFSLEDIAGMVLDWIREKRYDKPVIVGHSMGGYIALAMADHDSDAISGICLFHSSALPDSPEKKQSRNKVLEFIENQGVEAFTSNFVGQLYADAQHSSIPKVKNIAVQSPKETVVGYTKAMRDRKDRTDLLRTFPKPILFLAGEKDQLIPSDSILEQSALCRHGEAVILPEVGHMGMFESVGPCAKKISNFVEKCAVTFKARKE